jgi:putative ABC transport system permease protein
MITAHPGGGPTPARIASLAVADLRHDRRTTLVMVLTVGAIIAPLLLLLGLKNGVIGNLHRQLLDDPRNLEILVYGAQDLDRTWFEATAARRDLGFLVPRTRSINATIDLVTADARLFQALELIPTAPGDPLLPPGVDPPADAERILVTETLARSLGAETGGQVSGIIRRMDQGRRENSQLPLVVAGIVPQTRLAREAVFAHLDLLVAAEDYRDGLRGPLTAEGLASAPAAERPRFAGARVYAADLESVASLAEALRRDGIEIRTRADRIEIVQAVDRILTFVLRVVGLIGIGGCALALGGALWVNVDRKRRDLALLRLMGFTNAGVALVPLLQSAVIAATGFLLAVIAYLAGAAAFNRVLGVNLQGQGYVCRLDGLEVIMGLAATLGVAVAAAAAAAWRAGRVDPAECLRGVA